MECVRWKFDGRKAGEANNGEDNSYTDRVILDPPLVPPDISERTHLSFAPPESPPLQLLSALLLSKRLDSMDPTNP
jgi:hypothetical protein